MSYLLFQNGNWQTVQTQIRSRKQISTPHTPHMKPHTPLMKSHTPHMKPHTPHMKPHTPHMKPHTPHMKSHTHKQRRTAVEKNRLGTVSRKTTGDLNQFYSRETSPLILMQLEIHYENIPIQIYRKFHLQKLKIF